MGGGADLAGFGSCGAALMLGAPALFDRCSVLVVLGRRTGG